MEIKRNSPKHPYQVNVHYKKALDFGTDLSFMADTIEAAEQVAVAEFRSRNGRGGNAYVTILRNRKAFPEFDWEEMKAYELVAE